MQNTKEEDKKQRDDFDLWEELGKELLKPENESRNVVDVFYELYMSKRNAL